MALFLAYLLIAVFFVVDGATRKGQGAKSLERDVADRGSTMLIGASYGIAAIFLLTAAVLDHIGIGRAGPSILVGGIGLGLMVIGLALRVWATQVLGEFYTRTLRTSSTQRLVDRGPYRLIRHPGYLGAILVWAGAAIASANWITIVLIVPLMLAVYIYRIQTEEKMLASSFGDEYIQYAARTRRLIPFIY